MSGEITMKTVERLRSMAAELGAMSDALYEDGHVFSGDYANTAAQRLINAAEALARSLPPPAQSQGVKP